MIIVNGILKDENGIIDIEYDDGFYFGRGIFETILMRDEIPLFLEEHIIRINNGAKKLKIDNFVEQERVLNLIKKYSIKDCVLKIILSSKNIILVTREIPYKKEDYNKGITLLTSSVKRNETSELTYLKWTGYIENILEKEKAQVKGFSDALFLNTKDKVAETSSGNIFFIKNETIHTPKVSSGLLNGIVRNWITENFKVVESQYTLQDLIDSEGVFVTNSVVGIIKVVEIDGYSIKINNPLIDEIVEKYRKNTI